MTNKQSKLCFFTDLHLGGPVFSPAEDSKDIILEGVFSYMLWGTCRGRKEPSYAIQLSTYYDWILRHIPKKELCVQEK